MNRNFKYAAALALAMSTSPAIASDVIGSWTFKELMSDNDGNPGFAITSAVDPSYVDFPMSTPHIWISCYAGKYVLHAMGMGRTAHALLHSYPAGKHLTFTAGIIITVDPRYNSTKVIFGLAFNFDDTFEVFDAQLSRDDINKLRLADEYPLWLGFGAAGPDAIRFFPAHKTAQALDDLSFACEPEEQRK